MSNHISKQRKTSFEQFLTYKIHLLRSLSSDLFKILFCNHYVRLKFLLYEVSLLDSFYCVEYIRKNRLGCDVLGVSSKQLLAISIQYLCTEAELKEAEKRIVRLRKQKKMQREKLIRTISRGIFDMEELERVEVEEAVKVEEANRSLNRGPFDIVYKPIDTGDRYYPSL